LQHEAQRDADVHWIFAADTRPQPSLDHVATVKVRGARSGCD